MVSLAVTKAVQEATLYIEENAKLDVSVARTQGRRAGQKWTAPNDGFLKLKC